MSRRYPMIGDGYWDFEDKKLEKQAIKLLNLIGKYIKKYCDEYDEDV